MADRVHAPQEECSICHRKYSAGKMTAGELVQSAVYETVQAKHPEFTPASLICPNCLNSARSDYILESFRDQDEKITSLEKEVAESLRDQEILAEDIYKEYEENLTLGDRVADRIAEFGGSWSFLITFFLFIAVWVSVNTYLLLAERPFDPFPYILLNLLLSCIAAIQAPVIMMSQNRQEKRDRLQSQHDYQVNLKAELEIRHLHGKMDMLLKNQWKRLMEIQKMQMDIMEEMRRKR